MTDIWYLLQDHERYVYHYTSSQTLVRHILPTKRLRFSRFRNVNDPRESKNWQFSYVAYPEGFNRWSDLETHVNDWLKHTVRLACFVRDIPDAVMAGRDEYGAINLHRAYERGHSRPRMWSQYGENYAGACLVFDRTKLDASVQLAAERAGTTAHSHAVEYRDPRVLADLENPNAFLISAIDFIDDARTATAVHVGRHWRELFFLKARDWEQEREYRWLVNLDNNQDFFVDIEASLTGILIGDRFPACARPVAEAFARTTSVQLAEMQWQNGFPQPMPLGWGWQKTQRGGSGKLSSADRMRSKIAGFVRSVQHQVSCAIRRLLKRH